MKTKLIIVISHSLIYLIIYYVYIVFVSLINTSKTIFHVMKIDNNGKNESGHKIVMHSKNLMQDVAKEFNIVFMSDTKFAFRITKMKRKLRIVVLVYAQKMGLHGMVT